VVAIKADAFVKRFAFGGRQQRCASETGHAGDAVAARCLHSDDYNAVSVHLTGLKPWLFIYAEEAKPLSGSSCVGRGGYRVVDGDSLKYGNERIRLNGIYAAEMDQRGGRAARDNLQQIIGGGDVRVERRGQDKYGRTLADVCRRPENRAR
jgi:hypothetical protein